MSGAETTRRDVLKLFSVGAAALIAGCRPAGAGIVPYRDMPERMVPGKPLFFATSLPLGGAGRGVLIESHEGRPTRVHGNPRNLGQSRRQRAPAGRVPLTQRCRRPVGVEQVQHRRWRIGPTCVAPTVRSGWFSR